MPSSACSGHPLDLHSFPTRRSSDLGMMLRQLFLFSAAAVVPMGAAAADPQVDVKTSMGSFRIELYPAKAPKSVENFLQYVKSGHYNGTVFHRVITGFMVQGGGMSADVDKKPTSTPILSASITDWT